MNLELDASCYSICLFSLNHVILFVLPQSVDWINNQNPLQGIVLSSNDKDYGLICSLSNIIHKWANDQGWQNKGLDPIRNRKLGFRSYPELDPLNCVRVAIGHDLIYLLISQYKIGEFMVITMLPFITENLPLLFIFR